MFAMVEIKGKQYRIERGSRISIDRLKNNEESLEVEKVLLLNDGANTYVGQPYLKNARVKLRVEAEERGKKLYVFKYKRRKNYARRQGQRQYYSRVMVEEINYEN